MLLLQVIIYESTLKLLEVWMIDGKIDVEVPAEIAKLPNWKAPISIAVHQGSNFETNTGNDVANVIVCNLYSILIWV